MGLGAAADQGLVGGGGLGGAPLGVSFGDGFGERGQHDGRHDHDGHPADYGEISLDAYIARLVDAAPPLSDQQRDTLALLLHRPRRR